MQSKIFPVNDLAEQLVDQARTGGVELTGEASLFAGLVQRVIQVGLEAEMSYRLSCESYVVEGVGSGNPRNGTYLKTVGTDVGDVTVEVLRVGMLHSLRSWFVEDAPSSLTG